MRRELEDALAAGSLGFTTSRGEGHLTSDDRPVASRVADWGEVNHLVMAMGTFGRRVFEFAPPSSSRFGDMEGRHRFHEELLKLSVLSGTPLTWDIIALDHDADAEIPPHSWGAAAGGTLIGPCPLSVNSPACPL